MARVGCGANRATAVTRARRFPFALVEINANCVHNGVLGFLYRADGRISKAAYQVSSETCAYFKADLWGLLIASYTPHPVPGRDLIVHAA